MRTLSTPLWKNKPLLENSLVVWDSDNISLSALEPIKHLAKFTPHKRYIVSKKPLEEEKDALLREDGFTCNVYSTSYNTDARIVDLIDSHHHCTSLILISSDGDFVPVVKRFLAKHPVQWIMYDCNKKRICMTINLAHPHLALSTIAIEDERSNKNSKKRHKPAFYAPTHTSFANEAYWLRYFARYHVHIG